MARLFVTISEFLLRILLVVSPCSAIKVIASPDQDDIASRWIRWSNLPNPDSTDNYLVNVTVNGIDLGSTPIDTGSTGFLISATTLHYKDDTELKKYCQPAFEYLSSSKRFYEGYWLPSTVAFRSSSDGMFFSNIPVFAVTESGNCSSFVNGQCTKDQRISMPSTTKYMGVGFGRWSNEQPDATADKNPLLNVDFGEDKALRSGYVINDSGIILGLRTADFDDEWTLTQLTLKNPENHTAGDRPEWNGTPMCVEVADSKCFPGTALFDTGINYSFLGVPPGATQHLNITLGPYTYLKNDTEVKVKIGSPGNYGSDFVFKVGDGKSRPRTAPGRVRLVREHADGAFINTGRSFFNGFSLLYDEASGTVGLKKYAPNVMTAQQSQEHAGWRMDEEL